MNVPLVRPSFPHPDQFTKFLEAPTRAGMWSNFGPLWHAAAVRLEEMTGRRAFPCSNGTEAVAPAIHAAGASLPSVYYEAFTFEATRIAAKRIDAGAMAIRTDNYVPAHPNCDAGDVVTVRTQAFGARRVFRDEPGLVIDAAGAFSAINIREMPDDAFVAVSFHATKNFPIGEGGCVFAPKIANSEWARTAIMSAMNFGFDPAAAARNDQDRVALPGYRTNAKLDEVRCAILLAQLERADFFAIRSARIAEESLELARAADGWIPYDSSGHSQSLVVIAHREPERLVKVLGERGYVARRVYHPYINADLLNYDEARMVALPSDMTSEEREQLTKILKETKWSVNT